MKDNSTRFAKFAGSFYDYDPASLEKHVLKLLGHEKTKKSPGEKLQAIICPHAGYVYSGQTAGKTFKRADGFKYDRIVVLAPSHYCAFSGIAYSSFDRYEIPFGYLEVDQSVIKKLEACGNNWIGKSNLAHKEEHSLEVQLPFIKILFPETKIVPLVCGRIDRAIAAVIAESLEFLLEPNSLWVVSSDFTHYGEDFGFAPFYGAVPEKIKALDMGAIDKILELDTDGFTDYIEKTGATICGSNPIRILLETIRKKFPSRQKIRAELVEYTNSGDMTGDYTHCVSYAGIAFYNKSGDA